MVETASPSKVDLVNRVEGLRHSSEIETAEPNASLPTISGDFDSDRMDAALKDCTIPYSVQYLPLTDTTMKVVEFCNNHSDVAADEGLVLVAGEMQTGIGQTGAWATTKEDVKITIVLNEAPDQQEHIMVRIASALAVVQALKTLAEDPVLPVTVKWPNDIYTNGEIGYRKICGMLDVGKYNPAASQAMLNNGIELPAGKLLLGIGVNLNHEVLEQRVLKNGTPVELANIATSFDTITDKSFSTESVITEILRSLDRCVDLARRDPEELLHLINPNLAIGPEGRAQLDFVDGSTSCGNIHAVTRDGFSIQLDGLQSPELVPFNRLIRFYPVGTEGI